MELKQYLRGYDVIAKYRIITVILPSLLSLPLAWLYILTLLKVRLLLDGGCVLIPQEVPFVSPLSWHRSWPSRSSRSLLQTWWGYGCMAQPYLTIFLSSSTSLSEGWSGVWFIQRISPLGQGCLWCHGHLTPYPCHPSISWGQQHTQLRLGSMWPMAEDARSWGGHVSP